MKKTSDKILKLIKSVLFALILVCCSICFPDVSHSQVIGTAVVEGVVTDSGTGQALSGAKVTVRDKVAKTDTAGRFKISGIIPGRIIVEAKLKEYMNYMDTATFARGQNSFNISLKPDSGRMSNQPGVNTLIDFSDESASGTEKKYDEKVADYKNRLLKNSGLLEKSERSNASASAGASEERSGYTSKNRAFKNSIVEDAASSDNKNDKISGKNFISGKVMDIVTGVPISRAKIAIGDAVYFSDVNGEFTTRPVKGSTIFVRAESAAHNAYESNIKLFSGKNKIKILLMPVEENLISHAGMSKNTVTEYTKYNQKYSKIYGYVKDGKTGDPVANASVIVGSGTCKTNRDGYYSIEGLPAGFADISVIAGKYGVYRGKINLSGVVNHNDISLSSDERQARIYGTVTEKETGRVIYGAKIQVGDRIVITDTYGGFEIKDVTYDFYNMIVEQKGYQRIEKAISVNQESVNVNVEMADEYQQMK